MCPLHITVWRNHYTITIWQPGIKDPESETLKESERKDKEIWASNDIVGLLKSPGNFSGLLVILDKQLLLSEPRWLCLLCMIWSSLWRLHKTNKETKTQRNYMDGRKWFSEWTVEAWLGYKFLVRSSFEYIVKSLS